MRTGMGQPGQCQAYRRHAGSRRCPGGSGGCFGTLYDLTAPGTMPVSGTLVSGRYCPGGGTYVRKPEAGRLPFLRQKDPLSEPEASLFPEDQGSSFYPGPVRAARRVFKAPSSGPDSGTAGSPSRGGGGPFQGDGNGSYCRPFRLPFRSCGFDALSVVKAPSGLPDGYGLVCCRASGVPLSRRSQALSDESRSYVYSGHRRKVAFTEASAETCSGRFVLSDGHCSAPKSPYPVVQTLLSGPLGNP